MIQCAAVSFHVSSDYHRPQWFHVCLLNYGRVSSSLLSLGACQVLDPGFYQPGPLWFEHYVKSGASRDNTIQAILECGARDPTGVSAADSNDGIVLVERCMLEDGLSYVNGQPMCVWSKNGFEACQPSALIPKRDSRKRLTSQFCKTQLSYYPSYKVCLP